MFAVNILKMAYLQGFEPRLAVLETVVLPLTLRIHIEFVSSATIVISTIHPWYKAGWDSVRHYNYSSNASMFVLGYCAPRCLPNLWLASYLSRWLSFTNTYKTWWRRCESNTQCQGRRIYSPLGLPVFLHLHKLNIVEHLVGVARAILPT